VRSQHLNGIFLYLLTNKWRAHLTRLGSPDDQFCRSSNLSLCQPCQTISDVFRKQELLEKIVCLQILHVTPSGFCNNLRPSAASKRKTFRLQDAGTFHFSCGGVTPCTPSAVEWLSVEIRVCCPFFLRQVRQVFNVFLPLSPSFLVFKT